MITLTKEEWEEVIKEADKRMKEYYLTLINAELMKENAKQEIRELQKLQKGIRKYKKIK